ncbi:hypothetical protein ABPG72_014001 [Tetrahymena utriculariae]
MLHELELRPGRIFSFRPRIKYYIPMKKLSIEMCQELLFKIWNAAGIAIESKKERELTQKKKLELKSLQRFQLAEELITDGMQMKLILGRTGLTKGQYCALKQ